MTQKNKMKKELDKAWDRLSVNQRRYVMEYQQSGHMAESAKAVGLKPQTVYQWGPEVDDVIDLLQRQQRDRISSQMVTYATKAMERLPDLAESENERIALSTIKFLLNHTMGTPTQKVQRTNQEISSIDVNIVNAKDE